MTRTYLKDLKIEDIIARLKNGEVIFDDEHKQLSYKHINGILCEFKGDSWGCIDVGFFNTDYNQLFFEDKEPFKITKTGFYKTRDGRKVFISRIKEEKAIGVFEGDEIIFKWFLNGCLFKNLKSEEDIVAEWGAEDGSN